MDDVKVVAPRCTLGIVTYVNEGFIFRHYSGGALALRIISRSVIIPPLAHLDRDDGDMVGREQFNVMNNAETRIHNTLSTHIVL